MKQTKKLKLVTNATHEEVAAYIASEPKFAPQIMAIARALLPIMRRDLGIEPQRPVPEGEERRCENAEHC